MYLLFLAKAVFISICKLITLSFKKFLFHQTHIHRAMLSNSLNLSKLNLLQNDPQQLYQFVYQFVFIGSFVFKI